MRLVHRLSVLVMLPASISHELTHAAAASIVGEVERVTLFPPRCLWRYGPGTPRLAVWGVALAPTIVGLVVGLPAMLWVVGRVGLGPIPIAYAFGCWLSFTAPSKDDLSPFSFAPPRP